MTGADGQRWPWLRSWLVPLLLPTVAAAGLVLYDLTSRSIWLDESSTFAVASQHGATLWHLLVSAGGNFFLYYPLMHVVTSLFGSSLLALRLPSALAAIATVPVASILLTRLFDRRAAICGTWFLVLSGPLTFWGQQARGYSFAVLFVVTAALGLVTAMNGRRAGWWVFAGFAVLAIYTVLLSSLAVIALALSVVLRDRRSVPWRAWAASVLTVAVACVPLYVLAAHRGFVVVDWLGRPGTTYGPSNTYLVKFLLSAKTSGMPVTFASPVVLVVMVAAMVCAIGHLAWRLRRSGRDSATWSDGLLLLWVAVPPIAAYVFSDVARPILTDRYILTSVPAASMLAGVVVSRIGPRFVSGALAAVLVLALGYQLRPSYGVSLENWRGPASYVTAHTQPGDCVAFFVADGYDPVDFYVETGSAQPFPTPVLPATPYSARTSYALDPATFSAAELARVATSCSRLWLLRTHASVTAPAAGSPAYRGLTFTRYRILMAQIAPYFHRAGPKQFFTQVAVALYDRKP